MAYAKEPTVLQIVTLGVSCICFVLGIMCLHSDKRWNALKPPKPTEEDPIPKPETRYDFLLKKYRRPKFTFEEIIIIGHHLDRELDLQMSGIILPAIVFFLAAIHFYLCFIFSNLYYRKHFNIYFHSGGSVVLLLGASCYFASFLKTCDTYTAHFDIIYEEEKRPSNPCKFPQLEFGFLSTVTQKTEACQDAWTKVIVLLSSFINAILYFCTACVIGCFVEEEDSAELLYRELEIVTGGPYPPLSSLPPLPYYARPLGDSPTSKTRKKQKLAEVINRVEVAEDWTKPPPAPAITASKKLDAKKSIKP